MNINNSNISVSTIVLEQKEDNFYIKEVSQNMKTIFDCDGICVIGNKLFSHIFIQDRDLIIKELLLNIDSNIRSFTHTVFRLSFNEKSFYKVAVGVELDLSSKLVYYSIINLGIEKNIDKLNVENIVDELFVQKELERKLKLQIEKAQDILDSQPNIIFTMKDNKITECNRAFLDFFAYESLDDFKNNHGCICSLVSDGAEHYCSDSNWLGDIIQNKQNKQENRVPIYCKSRGEVRTFLLWANRLKDIQTSYLITMADITELESYQKKLKDKNINLNTIVEERTKELSDINSKLKEYQNQLDESQEVAKIGSFSSNLINQTSFWSKETYIIFGVDQRKNASTSLYLSLIHPEDRGRIESVLKRVIKDKISANETYRVIKDDTGEIIFINSIANVKLNTFGETIRVYGTHQDVTKQKLLENRQSSQEKLLVQQSKMAAMGEMIGAIAHQWKQPLNALSMFIQDLQDAYDFNEFDKNYLDDFLTKSLMQIDFMSQTINDFRDFFKPSKESANFHVDRSIKDVLRLLEPQLKKANIKISFKFLESDNYITRGFVNEFKQVILNLVTNSKDAIGDLQKNDNTYEGLIDISIVKNNNKIKIFVADNGGGIPESIFSYIFDPYISSKGVNGTGIGLQMAKIIVEDNMKGKIVAKNIERGAVFKIELYEA